MSLFNTGVRPAIDEYLSEKAKEKRDYGDYWSASSAGYCMRKVIFTRLGVPRTQDATTEARKTRVFESGHIFHEFIQRITKANGLSIAQELELQDEELMIRGHIDDLVLIKNERGSHLISNPPIPQDHLILYDYKTQNSRAFSYKRPEMSHYHKMQLGTYMYMLRKSWKNTLGLDSEVFNAELTEARILKISKDDLRMNEEQLMWSDELEQEVKKYWTTLNLYWLQKKLPKCTCADHENGFMAKEAYNDYFYNGQPCSTDWYNKWKEEKIQDEIMQT
jgi:hypothetical protein